MDSPYTAIYEHRQFQQHQSFCTEVKWAFKYHLAWGKILALRKISYWSTKETAWILGVSIYSDWTKALSLSPTLSRSPLHRLNVRPERGFARKHQPQTAYQYHRGSSSTTNRTRRYSSSGMTTTSMAFPKFDNVPVALKREKDLTAMTALSLVW